MTKFSQRLVEAMTDKHLSVDDLARYAGVSRSCIYSYLNRDAIPNAFTLECIADVLEVGMDWLWGRDKEKQHALSEEQI